MKPYAVEKTAELTSSWLDVRDAANAVTHMISAENILWASERIYEQTFGGTLRRAAT